MISMCLLNTEYKHKIGKLTNSLGSGSYGDVFDSENNYAIKIQSTNSSEYIHEMSIIKYLDHPNIIKTHGYHFDHKKRKFHMIMKKADCTLRTLINNKLSIKKITNIVFKLLQAVSYIHKKNILHRDIKPSNILITDDDVQLCDFGCSKYFIEGTNSHIKHTGGVQTIWYRSPEVQHGLNYSFKSDLWSVGAIILEMVANRRFFNTRSIFMVEYQDEHAFYLKWFDYLLKYHTYNIFRFPKDEPIIKLAFELMTWEVNYRLNADDALENPCFHNMICTNVKPIFIQPIIWFDKLTSKQTYINDIYRMKIFNHIWEVCDCFKIGNQIPIITFAIIDTIFLKKNISSDLHEITVFMSACIMVASKLISNNIHYDDLVYINDFTIKKSEIRFIEHEIMICLDFNVINILDNILKYRFDSDTWCLITCLLTLNNPISIDFIMNMNREEQLLLVNTCIPSKLKTKCLYILE